MKTGRPLRRSTGGIHHGPAAVRLATYRLANTGWYHHGNCRRASEGSVVITSDLEFAEWALVFGDEKMTAALLDRLTHRAHILPVNGDSYRFRESVRRQEALR